MSLVIEILFDQHFCVLTTHKNDPSIPHHFSYAVLLYPKQHFTPIGPMSLSGLTIVQVVFLNIAEISSFIAFLHAYWFAASRRLNSLHKRLVSS